MKSSKLLLGILVLWWGIVLVVSHSYALEVAKEDFESLSIGLIDGQGNWTSDEILSSTAEVISSPTHTGSRSLRLSGFTSNARYTTTKAAIVNSIVNISYWYREQYGFGTNDTDNNMSSRQHIGISDGELGYWTYANICHAGVGHRSVLMTTEPIGNGGCINGVGDMTEGNWYYIEVEYNLQDRTARVRVDGGAWGHKVDLQVLTFGTNPSATELQLMSMWDDPPQFWFDDLQITSNAADPNDGLVAYYPFNGNANDESGNGNHGTVYGASLTTDRFGNSNSAYSFDEFQWIRIQSEPALNFLSTEAFTLSAFVKPETTSIQLCNETGAYCTNMSSVLIKSPLDTAWNYGIAYDRETRRFTTGYHYNLVLWSPQIEENKWHHVIVIYSDCSWEMYLDGQSIGTAQGACVTQSQGAIGIGRKGESESYADFFQGTIDEVRLYNRALSETEIQQLYGNKAFTLPDTGQTKCYNNTQEIPCPNPGEPFYGQDGNYQGAQPAYRDNGDGTVTDLNTGLMWQKQDDGVAYTWYEALGLYDETHNPMSRNVCGELSTGGHPDWRVPTKKELVSIVHYGIANAGPTIDPVFSTTQAANYWSSTPFANDPGSAWLLLFYMGDSNYYPKASCAYVRCVRGGQYSLQDYVDNKDGTVSGIVTGLMWQQDEAGDMGWQEALGYCESLSLANKTDWRLPNIKELESITDDTRYGPAINTAFFPNAHSAYYWSSTTLAQNPAGAWSECFGDSVIPWSKTSTVYVRCVRGGNVTPISPQPTLTITLNDPDAGIVTGGGIKCGTNSKGCFGKCVKTYTEGTKVKLTATANDGWLFDHWDDGTCSYLNYRNPRTVQMTADLKLSVSFKPPATAWEYPILPYNPGSYSGRSFFKNKDHLGEDEELPEGTAIHAIGRGQLKVYRAAEGYGELVVVVEHDLGHEYEFTNAYGDTVSTRYILSIYGHLRKSQERGGIQTGLKVGDWVSSDTIIGYVNDDAHNGDGAEHLHMGTRLSSAKTAAQRDPGKWFRGYEKKTTFGTDFAAASEVIEILKSGL